MSGKWVVVVDAWGNKHRRYMSAADLSAAQAQKMRSQLAGVAGGSLSARLAKQQSQPRFKSGKVFSR